MRKMQRVFVLSTMACVLVISGIGTAKAQETGDEFMLEEMTVTANRVESLASKTPIAVTAVTGDTITKEGLSDSTMLENLVPNLSIVRDGTALQITIRGVTSSDSTEKGDPSAAFMVDNIYFGRQQLHDVNFYDIERVEVLRGPQGTLYGRNTTAGVVNVITNKPKEIFQSAFNATVGNYGAIMGDGMVNVPVSDTLAFRAAFSYQRRDNYIETPNAPHSHDPFRNDLSVRLQALYDINDMASLLVKTDYAEIKGSTWTSSKTENFSLLYDTTDPSNPSYIGGLSNDQILTDPSASEHPSDKELKMLGMSAELNWDFGPVALTYLGSYHDIVQDNELSGNDDNPPTRLTFDGDYWQAMQEIRLATTGEGPFQGQAGVYYFKEESAIEFWIYGVPFADRFGFPQDPTINESYAAFGQGTYSLIPSLRLTVGIRYSNDLKSRVGATQFDNPVYAPGATVRMINDAERTFTKTTWRLGLDYDLNDRTLLFGSVATGYKAGGFNDGCESDDPDCNQPVEHLYYNPENIVAYEVGTKTKISDKVVLNGTAFYYDYDNLQLSALVDLAGGGSNQVTINAAKAEVKGVEIESVLMPTPRNRINVNLAWLDAAYKDYEPTADVDYAGRPLDRSPEFTATLGYRYRHPLPNDGSIEGHLQFRWSDAYTLSNYSVPVQFEQPSFHKTDLSVTYTNPDGAWYVQVFGKNLEDEITFSSIGAGRGYSVTPSDPRTYGVRAGVRF